MVGLLDGRLTTHSGPLRNRHSNVGCGAHSGRHRLPLGGVSPPRSPRQVIKGANNPLIKPSSFDPGQLSLNRPGDVCTALQRTANGETDRRELDSTSERRHRQELP